MGVQELLSRSFKYWFLQRLNQLLKLFSATFVKAAEKTFSNGLDVLRKHKYFLTKLKKKKKKKKIPKTFFPLRGTIYILAKSSLLWTQTLAAVLSSWNFLFAVIASMVNY